MFEEACKKIRESVYGVIGTSVIQRNGPQVSVNATNATAFMVVPGYLITAAHFVHQENNILKPIHQNFEVIRAPEIGGSTEVATFVAEDPVRDVALLKIKSPKNSSILILKNDILPRGNNCGFLGFPLSGVVFLPNGNKQFNLSERFQGAYISNYTNITNSGVSVSRYEIDTLMYPGSSGCPGFNPEGEVIGMQIATVMQNSTTGNGPEHISIALVVPSIDISAFLKTLKVSNTPDPRV